MHQSHLRKNPPLPKGEEGEKQERLAFFPSLPLGERGQGSEGRRRGPVPIIADSGIGDTAA